MDAKADAAEIEPAELYEVPPPRKLSPTGAAVDGLCTVPEEGDMVLAEELGENCARAKVGGHQTAALCEWLREALLEERNAVARNLLSKHTMMIAELEARLCAQAPVRIRPAWASKDTFVMPSPPQLEAIQTITDLEQVDCGSPGFVYSRGGGEVGPPPRLASGEAITGLESRELASSPASRSTAVESRELASPSASRNGTVRRPRRTTADRRALRSEAFSSAVPGSQRWRSTMRNPQHRPRQALLQHRAQRLFHSKRSAMLEDPGKLRLFVTSNSMELISAVVILVTAMCAGLEVQYQGFQIGHNLGYRWYSSTKEETWPGADTFFEVMDYACGIAITIEMLLKMVALRAAFYRDGWNLLDLSVMVCWYMEVAGDSIVPMDATMLRMGRLVRLFRLLKLAKKIQGFDSLYLMTTAIRGSAASLGWSCCLLCLFQVVVGLWVHSILANWYLEDNSYPVEERQIVFVYWGSFSRAILTTFEITLADFPEPCRMLSESVNEWFAVFFVAHKLTIGFAVIGVINGVFIQETFKVATTDDQLMIRQRERTMKTHARKMGKLFQAADESGDGLLDLDEFLATMQEPDIQTWMASMDLDVEDAGVVFCLVDADGDGRLTAEELIYGVSRLMGDARNLDLLILMREQREIMRLIEKDVIPQLNRTLGRSTKRRTDVSQLAHTRLSGIGGRIFSSTFSGM